MANKLMAGHFQTKDAMKASGLNYAIFRNVLYMDAIVQFAGPDVFETGINLPAGQGRVAFALRSELGEAIATSLLADDWQQTTYHLTNSAAYSFKDVAAVLTRSSTRKVHYRPAEATAFTPQMIGRGVPERIAERVAGFKADIKNGQEDEISSDPERLLGRKPTSLEQGLKMLFKL
jgi:NAD(P)H dehydrogenase (quinone)